MNMVYILTCMQYFMYAYILCTSMIYTLHSPTHIWKRTACPYMIQPHKGFVIYNYMALHFIPPRSGTMAGNHCCYRRGTLCTDSECGGTVDMVSPRDWTTYLQHTMEDVVPAVFCCKGPVASRNCDAYQQKRPIDDGSKSPPPPPIPGNQNTVNDMTMS